MKTMTMQRQYDWILPALACMVLSIGGLFFKYDQRLPKVVWEGRDLIAGLEPRDLIKISFMTQTKSFSMGRQGEGFILDSQNLAPVDTQKLNEMLLRLGGTQISQVIGQKKDWDKYHVSEKNAELTLEILTSNAKGKWTLFLGSSVPGYSGRAVRLEGKEEVFVTNDYLYIPTSDTDFLSKEAFKISKFEVKNLEVYANGTKLDESKFQKDDILSMLEPLRVNSHFRTGSLPSDIGELSWSWTLQLLSESGKIYNVGLAKKGERWFAKVQADLNQSLTTAGPVIDIKLLALKSEVDRFNQVKMPWIWELATESAEKLVSGLMLNKAEKK